MESDENEEIPSKAEVLRRARKAREAVEKLPDDIRPEIPHISIASDSSMESSNNSNFSLNRTHSAFNLMFFRKRAEDLDRGRRPRQQPTSRPTSYFHRPLVLPSPISTPQSSGLTRKLAPDLELPSPLTSSRPSDRINVPQSSLRISSPRTSSFPLRQSYIPPLSVRSSTESDRLSHPVFKIPTPRLSDNSIRSSRGGNQLQLVSPIEENRRSDSLRNHLEMGTPVDHNHVYPSSEFPDMHLDSPADVENESRDDLDQDLEEPESGKLANTPQSDRIRFDASLNQNIQPESPSMQMLIDKLPHTPTEDPHESLPPIDPTFSSLNARNSGRKSGKIPVAVLNEDFSRNDQSATSSPRISSRDISVRASMMFSSSKTSVTIPERPSVQSGSSGSSKRGSWRMSRDPYSSDSDTEPVSNDRSSKRPSSSMSPRLGGVSSTPRASERSASAPGSPGRKERAAQSPRQPSLDRNILYHDFPRVSPANHGRSAMKVPNRAWMFRSEPRRRTRSEAFTPSPKSVKKLITSPIVRDSRRSESLEPTIHETSPEPSNASTFKPTTSTKGQNVHPLAQTYRPAPPRPSDFARESSDASSLMSIIASAGRKSGASSRPSNLRTSTSHSVRPSINVTPAPADLDELRRFSVEFAPRPSLQSQSGGPPSNNRRRPASVVEPSSSRRDPISKRPCSVPNPAEYSEDSDDENDGDNDFRRLANKTVDHSTQTSHPNTPKTVSARKASFVAPRLSVQPPSNPPHHESAQTDFPVDNNMVVEENHESHSEFVESHPNREDNRESDRRYSRISSAKRIIRPSIYEPAHHSPFDASMSSLASAQKRFAPRRAGYQGDGSPFIGVDSRENSGNRAQPVAPLYTPGSRNRSQRGYGTPNDNDNDDQDSSVFDQPTAYKASANRSPFDNENLRISRRREERGTPSDYESQEEDENEVEPSAILPEDQQDEENLTNDAEITNDENYEVEAPPSYLDRLPPQPEWFGNLTLFMKLVRNSLERESKVDKTKFAEICQKASWQVIAPTAEQRTANEHMLMAMKGTKAHTSQFYWLCRRYDLMKNPKCPYEYYVLLLGMIPFPEMLRRLNPYQKEDPEETTQHS